MTITTAPPTPVTDPAERAFLKALGKRIRIQRVTCDMNQEQLAQAARMSRNFVSSVERGAHGVDIVRVVRLALALGVTLPELLPDIRGLRPGVSCPADRVNDQTEYAPGAEQHAAAGPGLLRGPPGVTT